MIELEEIDSTVRLGWYHAAGAALIFYIYA